MEAQCVVDGRYRALHSVPANDAWYDLCYKPVAVDGSGRVWTPGWDKTRVEHEIAANLAAFLSHHEIPTSFLDVDEHVPSIRVRACAVIPLEIEILRRADERYVWEFPRTLAKGDMFEEPYIRVFAKNTAFLREHGFEGRGELSCGRSGVTLYEEVYVDSISRPSMVLTSSEARRRLFGFNHLKDMMGIARRTLDVLARAAEDNGADVHKLTLEFGVDFQGRLRIAQPLDNTSWTLFVGGRPADEISCWRQHGSDSQALRIAYGLAQSLTERILGFHA